MSGFSWTAAEYERKERSVDWFWGLGVFTVISAIIALYFEDYLFAVVLLLSGFSLALFSRRPSEIHTYTMSPEGIGVDATLYLWSSLKSFWVEERHGRPKIILISKKIFMPHIVIPIEHAEPRDVRSFLEAHLKEEEHHEPITHLIAERLGL